MSTMKEVRAAAEKRRAEYLAEQERDDITGAAMAQRYGMTAVRMCKLLKTARAERDLRTEHTSHVRNRPYRP